MSNKVNISNDTLAEYYEGVKDLGPLTRAVVALAKVVEGTTFFISLPRAVSGGGFWGDWERTIGNDVVKIVFESPVRVCVERTGVYLPISFYSREIVGDCRYYKTVWETPPTAMENGVKKEVECDREGKAI